MALGVVRMKRKAHEEPAEALVIALKKSKTDDEGREVYLKLAATLSKEDDFESGQIQAALTREKNQKDQWRQSPKHLPFHSTVSKRIQYYKAERKEKRLQVLARRRVILSQPQAQDSASEKTDREESVRGGTESGNWFVLYDIIEENEDPKSSQPETVPEPVASTITCNGQPLKRISNNRTGEYVYDVYYVAKGSIDEQFIKGSLSIQPCDPAEELVPPSDDDEPEVYYDDEEDSNDEDNWRNDYPDEDSDFEKNHDYYGDYEDPDYSMVSALENVNLGEDGYSSYKARVLRELNGESEDEDF